MQIRNFILLFIITLLIRVNVSMAQTSMANPWVTVENRNNTDLRIDISTIKNTDSSDIYVWGLDTYNENIKIEDIEQPIYRVKTYYLINPEIMRYSILEVVYYDNLNKVIKSFNYRKKSDDPQVKYNFPVLKGSPVEAILNKCSEYIKQKKELNKNEQPGR